MAYFSNGSEGEAYVESYCYRCVHWKDLNDGRGPGCPVWDLHLMSNYEECNKKGSYLHVLIPRSKDGLYNEQCTMFHAAPPKLRVVKSA